MATTWQNIRKIDLNRLNVLISIPYLLIIFLFVIFGLHIIAAVINGTAITDLGPLRLPALTLVTVFLLVLVLTVIQQFDMDSVWETLGNWNIMIGLILILLFVWWLSNPAYGGQVIPEIFSAVAP